MLLTLFRETRGRDVAISTLAGPAARIGRLSNRSCLGRAPLPDQAPEGHRHGHSRFPSQEGSSSSFGLADDCPDKFLRPTCVNDALHERPILGAIPAHTNEHIDVGKHHTASPLVAVSAFWEGYGRFGHIAQVLCRGKTWPIRGRGFTEQEFGRATEECRSWSMRKRITATPLPCESWRREGTSSSPKHDAGGDYDAPGL